MFLGKEMKMTALQYKHSNNTLVFIYASVNDVTEQIHQATTSKNTKLVGKVLSIL